jgi:hypothetical protein
VFGNVVRLVIDQATFAPRIALSPDFEFQIHRGLFVTAR